MPARRPGRRHRLEAGQPPPRTGVGDVAPAVGAETQRAAVGSGTMACRHRGHMPWNAGITRSLAQAPVRAATSAPSSSAVSSAPASAAAIAATTSSACPGVSRSFGAQGMAGVGTAPSAPVHSGRSVVGSRCTVPRGPYVFTRLRSFHSASRTVARVAPSTRSPTDTSAADITWACAPHMAATASAGPAARAGADNPCRSSRRPHTSAQDSVGTTGARSVIGLPAGS